MVAYDDITQITALHDEQNRIIQGMTLIDSGGVVASFTIVPPPYDPVNPPPPNPTMMMSVMLMATNPSAAFMQAIRDQMTARSAEISVELAALGVTEVPPDPDPPPPEVLAARASARTGAARTSEMAPPLPRSLPTAPKSQGA